MENEIKYCLKCGKLLRKGYLYCSNCGIKGLTQKEIDNLKETYKSVDYIARVDELKSDEIIDENAKCCPKCGRAKTGAHLYCPSCGLKYISKSEIKNIPNIQDDHICPVCGSNELETIIVKGHGEFDPFLGYAGYILMGPLGALVLGYDHKKGDKFKRCSKCGNIIRKTK